MYVRMCVCVSECMYVGVCVWVCETETLNLSCRRNPAETFDERFLRTGELCTCEYITLHQSFHRDTLSKHWCKTIKVKT